MSESLKNSFEITRDIVLGAEQYVPLEDKMAFAVHVAEQCCDVARTKIGFGDDAELMVPDVRVENSALRQRYLMGALYKIYLNVPFTPVENTEWLMAQDDYNRAASQFPMNQLERLKSDAAVRDKVFNILRDFKELERMVNAEIQNTLTIGNDMVARLIAALSMSVTPQALQNLSEAESALREQAKSLHETTKEAQAAMAERAAVQAKNISVVDQGGATA